MSSEQTNFHSLFRAELSQKLFSESDKDKRRQLLTAIRQTLDYRLAKGEKRAQDRGEDFSSSQLKEHKQLFGETPGRMDRHFISNEANIDGFFPYIEHKTGSIIGVGSDQVLDLLVNSECKTGYIVDFTETVSLFTRSLLEVGMYHKKLFGKHITPEELFEYFDDSSIDNLSRILSHNLTPIEIEKVTKKLKEGLLVYVDKNGSVNEEKRPYTDYLRFKSQMTDQQGGRYPIFKQSVFSVC